MMIGYTGRIFCFLLMLLFGAFPEAVFAQAVTGAIDQCISNYGDLEGITVPIMLCISGVVDALGEEYVRDIVSDLRNAIVAVFTIAIAVLGLRIALGANPQQPAGEVMKLVLKILMIQYLVFQLGVFTFIEMLEAGSNAVTDILIGVVVGDNETIEAKILKDTSDVLSNQGVQDGEGSPVVESITHNLPGGEIWYHIDHFFMQVMGLGVDETGLPQGFVGAGLVAVGVLLKGSAAGWLVGPLFTVAVQIIVAFSMIIFTYFISMIALLFMGAISPIVIPMILFEQTKGIFDQWVRQVVSYILQPLYLTAFLVFMFSVFSNVIGDFVTIYHDAVKVVESPEHKSSVDLVGTGKVQKSSGDDDRVIPEDSRGGTIFKGIIDGIIPDTVRQSLEGEVNLTVSFPYLDWEADKIREFVIKLLVTLLLLGIMISFNAQLPQIVNDLIGDKSVTNLAGRYVQPVAKSISRIGRGVGGE